MNQLQQQIEIITPVLDYIGRMAKAENAKKNNTECQICGKEVMRRQVI